MADNTTSYSYLSTHGYNKGSVESGYGGETSCTLSRDYEETRIGLITSREPPEHHNNIYDGSTFPQQVLTEVNSELELESGLDSSKRKITFESLSQPLAGSSKEIVEQESSDEHSTCFLSTHGGNKSSIESGYGGETSCTLAGDYEETRIGLSNSREPLDSIPDGSKFSQQPVTETKSNLGLKNELDAFKQKITCESLSQPLAGSSKEVDEQESSDKHSSTGFPTSSIKLEKNDVDGKVPVSYEDGSSEDDTENIVENSDNELNNDSDEGAYHLAEVSYGEEGEGDEDSQNPGSSNSEAILGLAHDYNNPPSPRLENNDLNSSETPLASNFIIQRKNIKTRDSESGKIHYRNFECLLCGYQAPQRSSLLDHIHKHTGERIHHCLHCDKKFRYKSYLIQHITVYHTDLAQFSCNLCNRRFVKESEFARHERTHSGERPFPCTFCNYRAKNKGNLKEHMRKHTGEKPYKCHLCSYVCAYNTLLKRHIAINHEKTTFSCNFCSYKTQVIRNFKEHLKTHTVETLFFCDKCNYKTHKKESLKSHIQNVHSAQTLLFPCTMCEAKFRQMNSLKRHILKHTNPANLYECKMCNKSFNQIRNFSNHNRKWHPKKDTT